MSFLGQARWQSGGDGKQTTPTRSELQNLFSAVDRARAPVQYCPRLMLSYVLTTLKAASIDSHPLCNKPAVRASSRIGDSTV